MHNDAKQQGLAELTMRAKRWVTDQPAGEFTAFVFGKELMLGENPEIRDMVLRDLMTMGVIEPCGNQRGRYRSVTLDCREMDWHHAVTDYLPIYLPLGINTICGVQKKNVIIVAGETNSGKTIFALDTIHGNLKCNGGGYTEVHLFNSEMGDGELRQRLLTLDSRKENWNGLRPFERTRDFHQVIDPDGFNVIDYLEVSDKFYLVGDWIQKIHEKLNDGVVVICIQKPKGKDVARGGEFSLEKCRLAVSLFYNHGVHSCKIVKCKLPIGAINPQGMERDFTVHQGSQIISTTDWRYMTEKDREALWKTYESDAAASRTRAALGL